MWKKYPKSLITASQSPRWSLQISCFVRQKPNIQFKIWQRKQQILPFEKPEPQSECIFPKFLLEKLQKWLNNYQNSCWLFVHIFASFFAMSRLVMHAYMYGYRCKDCLSCAAHPDASFSLCAVQSGRSLNWLLDLGLKEKQAEPHRWWPRLLISPPSLRPSIQLPLQICPISFFIIFTRPSSPSPPAPSEMKIWLSLIHSAPARLP